MDEKSIIEHIDSLVAEEKSLRAAHGSSHGGITDDDRTRLRSLEEQLDQCWDLLRQRRARSEFGESPDDAKERSAGEVEGYLQ